MNKYLGPFISPLIGGLILVSLNWYQIAHPPHEVAFDVPGISYMLLIYAFLTGFILVMASNGLSYLITKQNEVDEECITKKRSIR